MEWYVEHREEFLQSRERKAQIEGRESFDYDAIRELLETRGQLRELDNLVKHIDD